MTISDIINNVSILTFNEEITALSCAANISQCFRLKASVRRKPAGDGEKEGQVTPAGDILHWLKCINIEESVCVCVCSVVLHPAVLLDESIDHLLHGQIGDQLILGQRAAGHWVKMANTLQRENILFSSLKTIKNLFIEPMSSCWSML